MVSPDLFDFNRIEWLDVDEMLKYVELEYNKLTETCTALMGEISDSFPLIREYESYQVDLKLNKDELSVHREAQTQLKNEHTKLSSELSKVSSDIRSKIVCSGELKLKMLKHLRDMVVMLKLGREIMESKIDEERKQAMELMSDFSGYLLSEQEFTDFMNGKKQIEL